MLFALLIACAPELTPDTFAEDLAEIVCSGMEQECVGGDDQFSDGEDCREAYRTATLGQYDCEDFDATAADACLDEAALQMSCDHMTGGVDFLPVVGCDRICAD